MSAVPKFFLLDPPSHWLIANFSTLPPKKKKKWDRHFVFRHGRLQKQQQELKIIFVQHLHSFFTSILHHLSTKMFFCQTLFELSPPLPPCNGAAPPILGTSALCLHTWIIYFGPSSRGSINEDVCLSVDALIKSGTWNYSIGLIC